MDVGKSRFSLHEVVSEGEGFGLILVLRGRGHVFLAIVKVNILVYLVVSGI